MYTHTLITKVLLCDVMIPHGCHSVAMADLHNDVTYKAGVKVQQLAIENVWEIPNAC